MPPESPESPESPFASPRSPVLVAPATEVALPHLARDARRALLGGLAFVPALGLAILLGVLGLRPGIFAAVLALGAGISLWGLLLGTRTTLGFLRLTPAARPAGLALALVSVPVSLVGAVLGAFTALLSVAQLTRGRQLRRFGRVQLAPLQTDSAWSPPTPEAPAPVEAIDARAALAAEAWRKNGLTEHASVAAFARLSTELVALGAPPALIAQAHEDALDEVRHTSLCFALARELDGRDRGPGAFPAARAWPLPLLPRSLRLAHLAVESLIDGALNEGLSARVVAELSRTAAHPRARAVLEEIARDEARHAAHGAELVAWCVETGGPAVAAALTSAVDALPAELATGLTPAAEDGRLEPWGIPSRARETRALGVVRARLEARVGRLLHPRGSAPRDLPVPTHA